MTTAQLVPYGTVEALSEEAWRELRGALDTRPRSERSSVKRAALAQIRSEHAHLVEVYGLLFGCNTEPVLMFNRQYKVIGRVSWERATELMNSAVVTSDWSGYSIGSHRGDAVWIAHPESSDGKRAIKED
jgi:hypothetical protein